MMVAPAVGVAPARGKPLGAWPAGGLEEVAHCPVCGSVRRERLFAHLTDRVFFCAPGEWTVQRCGDCRAAYLDPRPSAATIALAYDRYYTHGETSHEAPPRNVLGKLKAGLKHGYLSSRYGVTLRPNLTIGRVLVPLLVRQRLGLDRWARHLPRHRGGQTLLDIGCGNGRFLTVAKQLGWDARGLDQDRTAVEAARRAGHEVTLKSLPETGLAASSFDVVTLSHMLEHAPEPALCLEEVHRILKPGGSVWIATPNLDGYSRLRFEQDWLALDPPRHLVLFTRAALSRACERAGFSELTFHRTLLSDYGTSLALADGRDPWEHIDLESLIAHRQPSLTLVQRAEATLAWLAALCVPQLSDEIILTAVKPAR